MLTATLKGKPTKDPPFNFSHVPYRVSILFFIFSVRQDGSA
jgi:hypothetical protein